MFSEGDLTVKHARNSLPLHPHLRGEDGREHLWEGWSYWSGMSVEYKGKRMGGAASVSVRMSENVAEWKNLSARICWV